MKIAVYISGYSPEAGGGHTFEKEIFECLLHRYQRYGHSFVVLSHPSPQRLLRQRLAGIPIESLAVSASRAEWIFQALSRGAAMRHRFGVRPSALDRAMAVAGADLLWFVAQPAGAQWTDYPYVTTVWDVQHRVTPWFPELTANGVWENREWVNLPILQRAAAVITGTRVGLEEIQRYYQVSPERIAILPHPTPQFAIDAATQPIVPLSPMLGLTEPYLFYPAQFWGHKNHANLLLALSHLRETRNSVLHVAFVGSDKGNKAYIQKMASDLGLAGQVHFLGFVSRDELVALYRNAEMLIYPSWFGPENLPPLEAFALGCPVAASRVAGAEEQLGDSALLFDPADPADMAGKITTLQDDVALRSTLIAAGRARARNWTAGDYVDGVMKIADKLEASLRCWRR
jgi:glycosyltransferase involved in cell wall biosynthesis